MKRLRSGTVAGLVLALAASAQGARRELDGELDFARALALRLQYVDLAEEVLGELAAHDLQADEQESLALVGCEIYAEAARGESDPPRRLEFQAQACERYEEWFDAHPSGPHLREAERSYLTLVGQSARALELALDDAVGQESERLEAELVRVLREGLRRTLALRESCERSAAPEAERLECWRVMLERAQLLATLGSHTPEPGSVFDDAQRELERVAGEAGETSGPGLNACLALAQLERARGRLDEAATLAEFVVTTCVPEGAARAEWRALAPEARSERFRLMELALPTLVESLAAEGEIAAACKWSLYLEDVRKREGLELSPFGHLAMLSAARTLMEAGGYVAGGPSSGELAWSESEAELGQAAAAETGSALDFALSLAGFVGSENRGNTLELRARQVISEALRRPGIVVDPAVLEAVALSEYRARNYPRAIAAFKQLLGALQDRDEGTRRAHAPVALFHLGSSYQRLGRALEAAVAFREATTWRDDPELLRKAAEGFYASVREVQRSSGADERIERLAREAEDLVIEASRSTGGADAVTWRRGERAYGAGDFDGARASFLAIGPGADEYERARVKAALCLYRKNDRESARAELRSALETLVPVEEDPPAGERRRAARAEARAQATYYLGKIAHETQRFDEVLSVLGDFEGQFPEQTDYAASALQFLVQAHLARHDLVAARAALGRLRERFPDGESTGRAALGLYSALKAAEPAAGASGDGRPAPALRREMAECLEALNRTAREPSFANLRIEAALWLELGAWAEAEACLRATLARFEGRPERAADLTRFVLPDLGLALLGARRVPEAFAVLDPLLTAPSAGGDDARKPSARVVRAWCRSVTGWLEVDGAGMLEVPGVGGDFGRACEFLGQLIDAERASSETGRGAWSCPWYELEFQRIYALQRWSEVDSRQAANARRLLHDLEARLGDSELEEVVRSCGGDELRMRFQWLQGKLR